MSIYVADDLIHEPTKALDWQESVVLVFLDDESGLAGFLRIGSEPNLGFSQVHFNLATRDGLRFRRNRFDLQMREGDRTHEGFRAGNLSWSIPDGQCIRVTADDAEARVDLRLYDFFESVPWKFAGPSSVDDLARGHLESSGRVEGRVVIRDREFLLNNALGHRDHSWGPRDVSMMRSFRWVAGTCGPDFSFSGTTVSLATGWTGRAGWVRRRGVLQHARDLQIVAYINEDGLTARGGYAIWELDDGERVRVDTETLDGFISSYRSDRGGVGSHVDVNALSFVRSGERTGFCGFNLANNITGGHQPAVEVDEAYATLIDGCSHRDLSLRWD